LEVTLLSPRPYLLRALYDWLVDSEAKPQIVVDAEDDFVQVPREFVRNGQIVLNISPQAVRALYIGDDEIRFSARFGGVSREVRVPFANVLGIFDGVTGQGMFLPPDAQFGVDAGEVQSAGRTRLRVVEEVDEGVEQAVDAADVDHLDSGTGDNSADQADDGAQDSVEGSAVPHAPWLRRIK